jgi:hypothetical protein
VKNQFQPQHMGFFLPGQLFLALLLFLPSVGSSPLRAQAAPATVVVSSSKITLTGKNGSSTALVINLGKSYKNGKIRLKLGKSSGAKVYILKTAPGAGTSWGQLVQGQQPVATVADFSTAASTGSEAGQFMVVVFNSDPGIISDVSVTAVPSSPPAFGASAAAAAAANTRAATDAGAAESPITSTAFSPTPPPVPPASN